MSANHMKTTISNPLELEEAVRQLRSETQRIGDTFVLPVRKVCGHILAEDIFAGHDQPPFPRSPFDGYAIRSEDSIGASADSPIRLKVLEEVDAGMLVFMTGEPVPINSRVTVGGRCLRCIKCTEMSGFSRSHLELVLA